MKSNIIAATHTSSTQLPVTSHAISEDAACHENAQVISIRRHDKISVGTQESRMKPPLVLTTALTIAASMAGSIVLAVAQSPAQQAPAPAAPKQPPTPH